MSGLLRDYSLDASPRRARDPRARRGLAAKRRNEPPLLLHLELCIDHVFGALGTATFSRGRRATAGLALHELRQRLRRRKQVGVGLANRLHVLAAHRLLGLLDRRADRRLVGLADLALVLLEQLLDLVDRLVRLIAGLDQLAPAAVLVSVGLGLLAHAL